MRHILKFLRSRFLLAVLCIILEFVQLVVVFVYAMQYVLPLAILGILLHFVVLLHLFNKDDVPEGKLPWVVLLMALPIVGAFVFLLLTSEAQDKKKLDRFCAGGQAAAVCLQPGADLDLIEDADARLQANYLAHITGAPCCAHTSARYYPIGEAFHRDLLKDLAQARRFILMEYFIIQPGVMWDPIHQILREKAAQGVEVYLMYDDFGCMLTLPDDYDKQLCREGIHCVSANRFAPVLSHIHNNRDHRKITVIDGAVGYTGGINLADEYINAVKKYGHWKDTAVRLEGEAVQGLTALFVANWAMQAKQPMTPEKDMAAPPAAAGRGLVAAYGDGPAPWYRESVGKNVYLNMIHSAKMYLYITTPYLICDSELMNALRLAAKKGVDVRLITPHIPDKKTVQWMTRSNYAPLLADGVKLYEYTPGFIHAKNFICDDKFAICGTINLDYRSLVHHFECGVWMYQTDCIPQMKADFLHTLECSRQVTGDSIGLNWATRLIAAMMKVFSPLL